MHRFRSSEGEAHTGGEQGRSEAGLLVLVAEDAAPPEGEPDIGVELEDVGPSGGTGAQRNVQVQTRRNAGEGGSGAFGGSVKAGTPRSQPVTGCVDLLSGADPRPEQQRRQDEP